MAWTLADALGMDRRPDLAETRIYRIVVRNLVLPCRIGVYEHERRAPQRVRINARLLVERETVAGEKLSDVLNYETIVEGIRALTQGEHIELLENLAERIMALCATSPRVRAARISAEKLDVFPDAESVGVVLRWRRAPEPPSA